MGLQEQLGKVVDGVSDIFSAPVGLVLDSARAITSDEYNPGFFGVFGDATQKLVSGLGGLGSGLGFEALGKAAAKSPLAPSLRFLFQESERIYSSEFQRETGMAPVGLRQLGVQPGDISLQRAGATVTGVTGATLGALRGGDIGSISYPRQWERAAFRTPGQAWVEEAVFTNFYTRPVEEQNEIRETAGYNLMSGVIDAGTRWVTDPIVVGGKAFKVSRNRFWTFRPDPDNLRLLKQRPTNHKSSLKRLGYGMGDEVVGPNRLPMVTLKASRNDEVFSVTRSKTLSQLGDEGLDFLDEAVAGKAALYSDEEIQLVRGFARDNGIPENQLDEFVDQVVKSQAAEDLNVETASRGLLGKRAKSSTTPRYNGTRSRPLQLFGADNQDEALRYAAALYQADPTDMPVILRIKADGLKVVFEEFDQAVLPRPGDYNPNDANFLTLAEDVGDNITDVRRFNPSELDEALNLDGAPSYLSPSGRLSGRLYHPDGTPIEPDQITKIENLLEDVTTAAKFFESSPIESEKFLEQRRLQRNMEGVIGDSLATRVMNNKAVQARLNWIDNNGKGRSMDEMRRVLFPNTPYGDIIASFLSDATTYMDRRAILLAAMGYKTSNFLTLEPMLRARLGKVLEEVDRMATGAPPSEMVNTLLGVKTKYTDSAGPFMEQFVDELLGELEDQKAFTLFLDRISDMAPIRQVRTPRIRQGTNVIRKTSFYQESPMARPIRAVSENRPHQWVNLKDPLSAKQVVRQMEEAQSLGISRAEIESAVKRYSAATNEQAKEAVLIGVNEKIVQLAAKRANMTPAEFEELLAVSRAGTQQVQEFLKSRTFASGNRDMVRWLDDETGELVMVPMPLLSTQTRGWVPLPNAKEIVRISKKIARVRGSVKVGKGVSVDQIPKELLDQFYRLWKPTVLLRGGWMIRVVSDEQLRVLAKTGSLLTHIAAISKGEVPKFTSMFDANLTPGQRLGAGLATVTGAQPLTAATVRVSKGITGIAEKLNLTNPAVLRHMDDAGIEGLVSSRASFGGPSEQTLRDLQALIGRDELTILDHLYTRGTGQWRSITRGEEGFGAAWARVLSDQYGRDPFGRKIVQDILAQKIFDVDDIDALNIERIMASAKKYLNNTAEGREIAERMPWRSRDPDKWVEELLWEINGYTAGFDENLLRGVLEQRVTNKMMEAIDERLRPDVVHGEVVAQTLGSSFVSQFIQDFTSEAFDLLGRLPTDTLSRQPFFKQLYATEMTRLERIRAQQGLVLDEDAIVRMNKASRQYAIAETKEYLYDLAEVSRFGNMARFIMPFFAAWQEIFTVWGKIALEDPSVIGRAKILWEAPNKAGMVYIDQDGEEFIQFRLSEQAAQNMNLNGWQTYLATGGPRFAKQSFNLILNNPLPGVGPPIQYPVNEIVKRKPELEESLRFLLPFGVSTDNATILLSPLVRQFKSEIQGASGDKSYVRAWIDAVTWMDVQYRRGIRTTPPTPEEAFDIADKLNVMRWITRLMSPAQPIWDTPLQPYIDIYRDMQDNLGPELANEAFLNEYGMEFFAVTLSRTVSQTGIPPTVEAEVARRGFKDLIEKFPEYGRLIIGDEALGEFSTAAFAAQLQRDLDPNNLFDDPERVYRSFEIDPRTGGIIEVDRRLGWNEYIKGVDILDLERKRRGLPNLRVKEAEDLAGAKRAMTEFLKEKYPSWWEDFNTRDDLKWDDRITAFRAITKDSVLQERVDIQGLDIYLQLREIILQELNRRKMTGGASTLDAGANEDLAFQWDTMVFKLLDENIAFGPLYFRYLEGDPVRLK